MQRWWLMALKSAPSKPPEKNILNIKYKIYDNGAWLCGEKNSEKKFLSSQIGIEPTTFRMLVGWSNHWVIENASGEQWVNMWSNNYNAQSDRPMNTPITS